MATASKTWNGPAALRRLVVPVGTLTPHPRNPRRGNVERIRESLVRFGQQRPILALPDGTIVAGNHTFRAAVEEGWTHIAVVRSDLTEGEIEAYLVADNRLSDLGEYDDEALAALLKLQYDADSLTGTGYERDEVEDLLAELAWAKRGARGDADAVAPSGMRPSWETTRWHLDVCAHLR